MRLYYFISLFFIFFLGNAQNESYYGFIYLKDGTSKSGKIQLPSGAKDSKIKFNDEKIDSQTIDSINLNINNNVFSLVYADAGGLTKKGRRGMLKNTWFLKHNLPGDNALEMFLTADKFKVNKNGILTVVSIGSYPSYFQFIKKKKDSEMIYLQQTIKPDDLYVHKKVANFHLEHYLNEDCPTPITIENSKFIDFSKIVKTYGEQCGK